MLPKKGFSFHKSDFHFHQFSILNCANKMRMSELVSLSNQQPSVKGGTLICVNLKTENGYDSYLLVTIGPLALFQLSSAR